MDSGARPHSAATSDGPAPAHAPSASALVFRPTSQSTFAWHLNGLDIQGDDDGMPSPQPGVSKKKMRRTNAVGLQQISVRVSEIVKSKGITTCNEVADELVAEFSDPDSPPSQQCDEETIRKRVYDALNVLNGAEIISKDKDKNEIRWSGLLETSTHMLHTKYIGLKERIEKKEAYLQELEDQVVCLQNLVKRNMQLYGLRDAPSSAVALPFILVQTHHDANVELKISEDEQSMDFDFNSTSFQLRDESFVMKEMGLCGKEEIDCTQASVANGFESSSTSNNHWQHSVQPPGPAEELGWKTCLVYQGY